MDVCQFVMLVRSRLNCFPRRFHHFTKSAYCSLFSPLTHILCTNDIFISPGTTVRFCKGTSNFSALWLDALSLFGSQVRVGSLLHSVCHVLRFLLFSCLPFGHFAKHRSIKLSLDAGKLRATRVDEGMDSYEDKALLVQVLQLRWQFPYRGQAQC